MKREGSKFTDDLIREILAEKEHITITLHALQKIIKHKRKSISDLAAIATFLHNIYSGMENLLKRILKYKKISLSVSESSHKDLLMLAVENQIISNELLKKLDVYRAFRHFFIHGYGIMLETERLMPLAQNLSTIWEEFESEIKKIEGSLKSK